MASVSQPAETRGVLVPGEHKHRRRFIGPMPESVLTSDSVPANRQIRKTGRGWFSLSSKAPAVAQEEEAECHLLRDVIKAHAYEFFKGHGGKDEDWGEEEETSVREEMLRRWKQSEWGKLRGRRSKDPIGGTGVPKNGWVGTSFDVGNFLGVNVLDKPTVTTSPVSSPPSSPTRATTRPTPSVAIGGGPSGVETFVTALERPLSSRLNGVASGTLSDLQNPSSYFSVPTPAEEQPGTCVEDSQLQGASQVMDRLQVPDVVSVSRSTGTSDHSIIPSRSKGKGKKKQVRYEDDGPTSPSDVLARSGQEVAGTSAGAAEAACVDTTPQEGGVIMRGQVFTIGDNGRSC